jgi:ADP-heptose:LPS heptosyltransferase
MWPAAHFRSLILAALETGLVREVIVTGSPAESTLCQNLVAACDHPAVRAYNDELEALAKFYVTAGYALGNSTGLMHLAALAGCRVLSLSEETGVDRAAPPGKGNYSLGPPVRQKNGSRQILAAILPQVVLDQLGTMIAEGSVLE